MKSEGQNSDYERQPGHEALIYLSEKKLEYRKKRLDCEELQMIEILETAYDFTLLILKVTKLLLQDTEYHILFK